MSVFRRIMLGGGIIDIDTLPDTQKIYYKATAKVTPKSNSLVASLIANKWDSTTGDGIIVCYKDISNIGNDAFSSNTSLTSITIPNSVTSIGNNAFYGCDSLESVTIGKSVTTIGEWAFYQCSGLTSINIPDSVTSIGDHAFGNCTSLPVIDNLRYADTYLVGHVDKTLAECTIKEGTRFIGNHSFSYYKSLTNINIPDSVTSIGSLAFYHCESLTSIIIPDSITSIRINTFNSCYSLTSITIPDSVMSIRDGAFQYCYRLTSVYCKATAPPSLGGSTVFDNNGSDRKIYVPMESVDAYKSATNWSEYADSIIGYDFGNNTVIE